MKILKIVGPQGAGKSTALLAMMADRKKAMKYHRFEMFIVEKGGVNDAKKAAKDWIERGNRAEQIYVDYHGRPTPAFMNWLTIQAEVAGAKYLVIAHAE